MTAKGRFDDPSRVTRNNPLIVVGNPASLAQGVTAVNMISMSHYDVPVRVYFDMDHATAKVSNLAVYEGEYKVPLTLSERDRTALIELIRDEVALNIFEAALIQKEGKLVLA